MRRRLEWEAEHDRTPSPHPYRDVALVYLGFAVLIVVVSVATGGGLVRAVVAAAIFWAAGTTYGILARRRKLRRLP